MRRDVSVDEYYFPEIRAGGFSRADGAIEFYTRINALAGRHMIVVDFGAGRGMGIVDDPVEFRRTLRTFKGKVGRVIGVDVDESVRHNPALDEAIVVDEGQKLPIENNSIDMIIADFAFEHLRDPEPVCRELHRILKPHGWLCARTPNRWGYIGVAARAVPNSLHELVLRWAQPYRRASDVFPAFYRLNTRRAIKRHFANQHWDVVVYTINGEPAYFGQSRLAWKLMLSLARVLPESFGAMLHIFARKRS